METAYSPTVHIYRKVHPFAWWRKDTIAGAEGCGVCNSCQETSDGGWGRKQSNGTGHSGSNGYLRDAIKLAEW